MANRRSRRSWYTRRDPYRPDEIIDEGPISNPGAADKIIAQKIAARKSSPGRGCLLGTSTMESCSAHMAKDVSPSSLETAATTDQS